jgi:hypothetical protein
VAGRSAVLFGWLAFGWYLARRTVDIAVVLAVPATGNCGSAVAVRAGHWLAGRRPGPFAGAALARRRLESQP